MWSTSAASRPPCVQRMLAFLQLKGQCFLNVTQTLAVGFGNARLKIARPRQKEHMSCPLALLIRSKVGPLGARRTLGYAASGRCCGTGAFQIQWFLVRSKRQDFWAHFPIFRDTRLMFVLLGQLQLQGWKDPIRKISNGIPIFFVSWRHEWSGNRLYTTIVRMIGCL